MPFDFKKYIVFAWPQRIAALLLLCFAAQCAWLAEHKPLTLSEQDHIGSGMQLLSFNAMPRVTNHTPLVNLVGAAPLRSDSVRDWLLRNRPTQAEVESQLRQMRRIVRLPFLFFGLLLGGSLWYVARRLYGNEGGYVALALFCFSPAMVLGGATINSAGPAAWGIFGIIFTGIAISHNLYAPWKKWRYRTLLLGLAVGIAIASHTATLLLLPLAFLFMLYLTPGRRAAAFLVMLIACAIGLLFTCATYNFNLQAFMHGLDMRDWLTYQAKAAQAAIFGDRTETLLRFSPTFVIVQVVAIGTFFWWKRTRYFGNTAPLITGVVVLYLALITPLALAASLWALPFFYVFAGGIAADWLESKHRKWALAVLLLVVVENAIAGMMMLKHLV